ncbi:MAG: M3 family metallopeptidase, partial [Gemmatimonadales bacterium]
MTLDRLVAEGEELHEELGREYYVTGSGLKSDPEFQDIYDRHPFIISEEALTLAQVSGSAPILEWIVETRVGRAVAPLEERQLVWEQHAEVEVDGSKVPYLRAPIVLANSPDRDYRRALDMARAKSGAAGLNDLRRERFQLEHSMVEELGMGQYVEAQSRLSGIDLDELGVSCTLFLDRTGDMYEECLERLAKRRLGLELGRLQRADAGWLFRADRFDGAFPSERLVETAARQMGEMGLDHTVNGRVRFDTEERDGKQPRAFCVPVQVPEEVYLVLRPRGGHSDFRTFWHELGHAMHFASVEPGLPFEARWLGDASVTEGFAMLWDHLTINRRWLGQYTDLSGKDASELAFELAVAELFMARRYAAKLNYELELHRSEFTSMASR